MLRVARDERGPGLAGDLKEGQIVRVGQPDAEVRGEIPSPSPSIRANSDPTSADEKPNFPRPSTSRHSERTRSS